MKKKYIILIIAFVTLIGLYFYYAYQNEEQQKGVYHIAMVGPLSGSGAIKGQSVLKGIHLYLDKINQEGGFKGKSFSLSIFDDQNDKSIAADKAKEISDLNKALMVIGHWYSSCSMAAGEIYKKSGIPAITPGATNIKVTDSEWYFRTVFNDRSQGRFLANYTKKVLNKKTVSIIYEDLTYGSYLADVFEETAKEIGMEVIFKHQFETKDDQLDASLSKIVTDLKTIKSKKKEWNDCAIFMATHATEGIKLVKLMKDAKFSNSIIVPDSLASKSFPQGFNDYQEEKSTPGFYTDGIYATSPLIFDTANEKAQLFKEEFKKKYHEAPDWIAAYGYDTAMVVVEAIKRANIKGYQETIVEDRQKIRNFLASLTDMNKAIEGVTGFNYFDEKGDCPKPISIGVYKFQNTISALTQLKIVPNINEIVNLQVALDEERVLYVDNSYMYKTSVVYTGIEINEINDLNMHNLTYEMDFYIWFRYKGDIHPENVIFINAVEPINLRRPVTEKVIDGITYKAYHVKGRFRADFLPDSYAFRQHVVGVGFHHREFTRNNLIYVIDFLGMGLASGKSLVDELIQSKVFDHSSDWAPINMWFFQDTYEKNSLGSPEYLDPQGGTLKFSRFNLGIRIKKSALSLRGIISREYVHEIIILCSVMIVLISVASKRGLLEILSKYIWFVYTFFAILFVLSSEIALFDWLVTITTPYHIQTIVLIFDILWFIIPAYLLNLGAERFLWLPLEEKSGRTIPKVARRFVAFIIYILAVFGIVAFVFNQKLTSLLATSGMFAMIVGLAIQVNISNVFAGIALNLDRPFRTGDWVLIANYEEGIVFDITWRATRLKTRNGCILCIPNSEVSENQIHNFSYPDGKYWQYFTITIDPLYPPDRVKKVLLDAALSVEAVLKDPSPTTRFMGLNESMTKMSKPWGANYLISVCVQDYGKKFIHNENVWHSVIQHLRAAGIDPITQRQEIHMFQGIKTIGTMTDNKINLMDKIDIFQPLIIEARQYLSQCLVPISLNKNSVIYHKGEEGRSLFIITEGVVAIMVPDENNHQKEIYRVDVQNIFGEYSFLTGDPRRATAKTITQVQLFEINASSIAPIIGNRPEICLELSKILAQRILFFESKRNCQNAEQIDPVSLENSLYSKITTHFSSHQYETIINSQSTNMNHDYMVTPDQQPINVECSTIENQPDQLDMQDCHECVENSACERELEMMNRLDVNPHIKEDFKENVCEQEIDVINQLDENPHHQENVEEKVYSHDVKMMNQLDVNPHIKEDFENIVSEKDIEFDTPIDSDYTKNDDSNDVNPVKSDHLEYSHIEDNDSNEANPFWTVANRLYSNL